MTKQELLRKIDRISKEIESLPTGYISRKEIGEHVYFYHQWTENGAKKSRYLTSDQLLLLSEKIDQRNLLRDELNDAKRELYRIDKAPGKSKEDSFINCKLMHKNFPVADIVIDETNGTICKTGMIYAAEHLPVGVKQVNGKPDKAELNEWWTNRSIPASRSGVREAMESLHINNTTVLLTCCYGLSLSDQYWICPDGSSLEWEDINFFTNEFSEDIGDILFGSCKEDNAINFSSPDNTSDGNLKKRWKIIDGKRCLVKGGSNPYRQQPFNEVIATKIMEKLGVDCVPYSLVWNQGAPYSVCADFIDENTELIPAWRVLKTQKRPNNVSLYNHFTNCAEKLGIPDVVPFLDRMIVIDYLILNEDRHLNNFGALRNAETLEWIGMAPVYDSGSSLGYDKTTALMRDRDEIICKPFKNHHEEQLKLVSSFDWIDFSKLSDIGDIIRDVLLDEKAADYLDENRINMICNLAKKRVKSLREFAESCRRQDDSMDDDVKHNKAAEYS